MTSPRIRFPAEWEPQQAVWLAWPHQQQTWPGHFQGIPELFAHFAELLAETTRVRILAEPDVAVSARALLPDTPRIELVDIATNDCWIRDFGPTFVHDASNGLRAVDWRYNAWGGKYPPWDLDDAAASKIADVLNVACTRSTACLEGGAIETDGTGRLLTTPSCLLAETRNPGWSAEAIAEMFYHLLGITEVVWVDGGGLQGDDTDGHIDQLARFVDASNVVVAVCDDADDPNREPLEANFRQLRLWGQSTSPRVEVHRLPIPRRRTVDGTRVPESYCNFLMLGADRILLPTFGDPEADDRARGILSELRPEAKVDAIDCRKLVWGLGALHCASLNQPASPA